MIPQIWMMTSMEFMITDIDDDNDGVLITWRSTLTTI